MYQRHPPDPVVSSYYLKSPVAGLSPNGGEVLSDPKCHFIAQNSFIITGPLA